MEIYFKLINPGVQGSLLNRIEKKFKRIGRLVDERSAEARAYIEITKETASNNSDDAWRTSINLDTSGGRIHAESSQATPELSANRAAHEIVAELQKQRARTRSVNRKADGFWKSFMRSDSSTAAP
ncbi:MAG: hypothetical protein JWL88_389 [Parcubacteria group bacterium]|nr:hypothetical protein [Parcubacteria group bacterium]